MNHNTSLTENYNHQNKVSLQKIDARLSRIANILLLNACFKDNLGLFNGKMGIAIFFYHYARYTDNKIFEDYAGDLLDEIYEEINTTTPVDFANGLLGIGWGIEYLVKCRFIEADTDETLEEIDTTVYHYSRNHPFLLDNDDLFGFGLFYIARLKEHRNIDDDLNTHFVKNQLIYLTDEFERILVQKTYLKFNVQDICKDTINSFLWFLLEIHRLQLFPAKVEKLFHGLPEFIESASQSTDDWQGKFLLHELIKYIIPCITDKDLQRTFRKILKKTDCKEWDKNSTEDSLVGLYIKDTWQRLIYAPYTIKQKACQIHLGKIFSIIDNEEIWNRRLDNLNENTLGLKGLAGIGLGLLRFHSEGLVANTTEHIALGSVL